ncbi:MAG: Zn-ribbon domain-containing protein [Candidatus Aenigmatarchaeota archaeon]
MPHKCLNCGKVLDEDSDELMEGCSNCGQKLFVYEEGKKKMDEGERETIVQDVEEFIDSLEEEEEAKERLKDAMEFDLESIKVEEPGVYEINLRKLLEEVPLIVEMKEGEYYIYLPSAFSKERKSIRLDDLV